MYCNNMCYCGSVRMGCGKVSRVVFVQRGVQKQQYESVLGFELDHFNTKTRNLTIAILIIDEY